jgi:hypothetical protein
MYTILFPFYIKEEQNTPEYRFLWFIRRFGMRILFHLNLNPINQISLPVFFSSSIQPTSSTYHLMLLNFSITLLFLSFLNFFSFLHKLCTCYTTEVQYFFYYDVSLENYLCAKNTNCSRTSPNFRMK